MILHDAALVTLVVLLAVFGSASLYARWRLVRYRRKNPALPAPAGYTVTLTEQGRSGLVAYQDDAGSARFDWEFGGADVVVIVFVPSAAAWPAAVPWAADRRAEIVERVAGEVWRQRCRGCVWTLTDDTIEFNNRTDGGSRWD